THALDPSLEDVPQRVLSTNSWASVVAQGGESATANRGCSDGGPDDRYPLITNCPTQNLSYAVGGPGLASRVIEDRRTARAALRDRLGAPHRPPRASACGSRSNLRRPLRPDGSSLSSREALRQGRPRV